MKKYILILIIFTFTFCKSNLQKDNRGENEFFITIKDSSKKIPIKDLIISKLKKVKRNTSIVNNERSDWVISVSEINEFLEKAVIISNSELHHLYNQEQFSYEGEIKYKNEIYEFEINGGGWMDILNKQNDSTMLLGCNLTFCEKIFISRGISQYE